MVIVRVSSGCPVGCQGVGTRIIQAVQLPLHLVPQVTFGLINASSYLGSHKLSLAVQRKSACLTSHRGSLID